ncbi:MAG: protein kinase [Ardenticatenaceae bacterium]|nr:protein kinase [Ardenticatenaceae bacterium]
MIQLRLFFLGQFHIELEEKPATHFATNKVQALLAYLAVEAKRPFPRTTLATLLWPDMPDADARHNLRQTLFRLRQTVPDKPQTASFFLITHQTIQFNLDSNYWLDVTEFDRLLSDCQRHDHQYLETCAACMERLETAVSLYHGDFLDHFYVEDSAPFEEWALAKREWLRREALNALTLLSAYHDKHGNYEAAQQFAQQQIDIDPLREEGVQQLMRVLVKNGRRSEAIAQYHLCKQRLSEELDVAPAPETAALYEKILASEMGITPQKPGIIRGYDCQEIIGTGAFGVVYRAVHPLVERDVAVKIIQPQYANNPDFIRRFEAEARIVARLEHPYIVPLYDYWREPNAAYLVMRYLRGGNLRQSIQQGPWELEATCHLIEQITAALATAHRQGIVHRDIKPENILLDKDGTAYLADFGIAKDLLSSTYTSETGRFTGSIAYSSPEQAQDQPITPQSDQYSLGVVLFELLVGQHPFPEHSPAAMLVKHLNEPLPSLQLFRPDVPLAINDIIQCATAKDPHARFPDILTFANAFQQAAQGLNLTNIHPPLDLLNPYMGLLPFEEADAHFFYGRSALIQHLLQRLSPHPFLAIIGPSGCGKSSLVKAGLIPALRQGALPGSDRWLIVEMVPGTHPLEELEISLLRIATHQPAGLMEQLQRDERGLLRTAKLLLPERDSKLLLVIDQFEELFSAEVAEAERAHFLANLVTAVSFPNSRIHIIITLRADFYDRPLRYASFSQLLRDHTEVVIPMTNEEIIEAITGPAKVVGLTVEPTLIAAMTADISTQPAALPLLQYALTELFKQRNGRSLTLTTYESIGGIAGALTRRAETLYQNLDENNQQLIRQIFLRLITLGEGSEDTRRRVPLSQLNLLTVDLKSASNHGFRSADYRLRATDYGPPITDFAKHRLLTFDRDPGTREPTVEVAHEALLREWPRLHGWLEDSRDDIRQQQKLATAVSEWQQHNQASGFLLRGSRLDQFAEWADVSTVQLTPDELAYLKAGLQARAEREAAEAARQAHEKELEQRSRTFLRTLAIVLLLATVGGLLATAVLLNQRQQISVERDNAEVNLVTAVAAQATSDANAATATVAQGEAVIQAGMAANAANARATAAANARAQQAIAETNERQAQEAYSLALVANARQALADNDTELAMLLALAANNIENPPIAAQNTLVDAAYAPGTHRLFQAGSPQWGLAVVPNSQTIWSGSDNGDILIWDVATGEIRQRLNGHTAAVTELAIHPNGKWILSASVDQTLILWDATTGTRLRQFHGHTHPVSSVAFSADGRFALSGGEPDLRFGFPGELILWDVDSGEIVSRLDTDGALPPEGVRSVAILPDGHTALVGVAAARGNETPFLQWDLATGTMTNVFPDVVRSVNDIALSEDGRFALTASSDNLVRLWNLETGELVRTLAGHDGVVTTVTFGLDGETAVSAGLDQTLIWWDLTSGDIIQQLSGHTDAISTVRFLSETQVVSTSLDGSMRLWDLTPAWQLAQWRGTNRIKPEGPINTVAISPNGQTMLSASGSQLILWETASGEPIRELRGHENEIWAVSFSPDGRKALSGGIGGELIYWNVETGSAIRHLTGHQYAVNSIALNSDGTQALTAAGDEPIILWDLQTGEVIQYLHGHTDIVEDVTFWADDQMAISGSWDDSLILWDLATGEQVQRLTGLGSEVGGHFVSADLPLIYGIALLPNGRSLLSASSDQTLLLWDLPTGQPLRRFVGHDDYVIDVQVSENGRFALSLSTDGTAIWWDVETGTAIRRIPVRSTYSPFGVTQFAAAMAIAPDGETAVIGQADGSLIQWQLTEPPPTEIVPWIQENRSLRNWTCLERTTYQIAPLCNADGIAAAGTDALLANVAEKAVRVETAVSNPEDTSPIVLPTPPARTTQTAVLGDNLGELTRYTFDVWRYEGKANELLTIHLIANNPPSSPIPPADRLDSNKLDTVLILIAPDGSQVALIDDGVAKGSATPFDALIDSVRLPVSGLYRIEARSIWDVGVGGYTLRLDSREITVAPELLQTYVGRYFHQDLGELIVTIYLENGTLMYDAQSFGLYEMRPLSDTEFIVGIMQLTFLFDENGAVMGYDIVGNGDAFYGERIEE